MKKLIVLSTIFAFLYTSHLHAKTIRILMETVPDTRYLQELLPEFEQQTGIKVEIEAIGYVDMHTKLVPQLIAPQGSYDLIVVDFYWVGEFTKAKWLMPLDDLVKRDNINVNRYIPALMNLVGRVDGTIYMLPFYNYSMAMVYRKDLINDPNEKANFKAQTGFDLKVPTNWSEYWKQVEFFTRDKDNDGKNDFFGTVIQGQRGDCIAMHWSNFLYAQGGRYNANNGEPLLNSAAAISAMAYYKEAIAKYSPEGSASYCFDEAFNIVAQGNAYSLTTFNIMYAGFDDPKSSSVVGKIGIAPNPGGGLNGAWGWAIPNSSTQKEEAWNFIKWAESYKIAKKRAMLGGAPTQSKIFNDPDILRERPYYPILGQVLAGAQEFPVFTYTTEFVEKVGRELNLAATGEKEIEEAMNAANKAYRKLLVKDGKL